jgi:hypothetical protein
MRANTGWLTPTNSRVFRTSLALYFPGSGMVRTVRTVYFSRNGTPACYAPATCYAISAPS